MRHSGGEDSMIAARNRLCRAGGLTGLPADTLRRLADAESQLDVLDASTRDAWAFITGLDEEDTRPS